MFFFFEISMPYTKELFDNDEKKMMVTLKQTLPLHFIFKIFSITLGKKFEWKLLSAYHTLTFLLPQWPRFLFGFHVPTLYLQPLNGGFPQGNLNLAIFNSSLQVQAAMSSLLDDCICLPSVPCSRVCPLQSISTECQSDPLNFVISAHNLPVASQYTQSRDQYAWKIVKHLNKGISASGLLTFGARDFLWQGAIL